MCSLCKALSQWKQSPSTDLQKTHESSIIDIQGISRNRNTPSLSHNNVCTNRPTCQISGNTPTYNDSNNVKQGRMFNICCGNSCRACQMLGNNRKKPYGSDNPVADTLDNVKGMLNNAQDFIADNYKHSHDCQNILEQANKGLRSLGHNIHRTMHDNYKMGYLNSKNDIRFKKQIQSLPPVTFPQIYYTPYPQEKQDSSSMSTAIASSQETNLHLKGGADEEDEETDSEEETSIGDYTDSGYYDVTEEYDEPYETEESSDYEEYEEPYYYEEPSYQEEYGMSEPATTYSQPYDYSDYSYVSEPMYEYSEPYQSSSYNIPYQEYPLPSGRCLNVPTNCCQQMGLWNILFILLTLLFLFMLLRMSCFIPGSYYAELKHLGYGPIVDLLVRTSGCSGNLPAPS